MAAELPETNPAIPRERERLVQQAGRTKALVRSNALWRVINERMIDRKKIGVKELDQPDQYDPVVELAVMGMDPLIEPHVRVTCHKAVASFLYPTLSAVHVTDDSEAGSRSNSLNHRLIDLLEKAVTAAPTPKVIDQTKVTDVEPGKHGGHD